MSDPSLFAVGALVFILVTIGAIVVLWRMKAHLARKADAEARMQRAMLELHTTAARLQSRRNAGQSVGPSAIGGASGPPPEA